jgi:energy-coupling factor transporter ATP-binding protein EcfA2
MDDVLLGLVLQRLEDEPLPEASSDLLLAAMDGPEALASLLSGETEQRPSPGLESGAIPPPAGAYLASLTVSGFRGVGPPATLDLPPGPGLTLVLGRNGSGKSTFAEALELLLTGDLSRWAASKGIRRDGWRSIHQPGSAVITAEFLVEGSGRAVVRRTWPAGADFAGSVVTVQLAGEKVAGLDRLGWSDALQAYRPFLSYAELAAFSGRPSELHDVLASVLGMEDLTAASGLLATARKQRESALSDVRKRLPGLLEHAAATGDERAGVCQQALSGRDWDLATVRAAAAGSQVPDGSELAQLRLLAQLSAPDAEDVRHASAALREAADALDAIAGSAAGQAHALAGLLADALRLHAEHGDGDCPVCHRAGALTGEWRQATQEHLDRLRKDAAAAKAAHDSANRAGKLAAALPRKLPAALAAPPPSGLDSEPARKAWASWEKLPDASAASGSGGLRALAAHLDTALPPLAAELAALSAQADAELSERADRWAPVAAELASWCADAAAARDAAAPVAALKDTEQWLKAAVDDIRNARLAPLADQAREIWGLLRQESNVDLGEIRLTGALTRRQLELDVSVDGTPGTALGVMSQGEINALALSIFIPRATMPESPFCFLVIDDPVQAMDPAKVDGLARVLEQAAANRQVIVFTHDNRLAEAVRTLRIQATVLEVTRRPKSVVDIRACQDPVKQALDDAFALCADKAIPDGVAARVIPGLCRTAVEAALTEAAWRGLSRAGRRHDDIESALISARRRLTTLAALAMFGDEHRGGEVLPKLRAWGHQFAGTYQALNKGAHEAHLGDLRQLAGDARRLTEKIGSSLP